MLDNNNNNNTSTTAAGNAIRAAKQRQSSKVELRQCISKLDDNIRTSRQDLRRLKGESKRAWKKRVVASEKKVYTNGIIGGSGKKMSSLNECRGTSENTAAEPAT